VNRNNVNVGRTARLATVLLVFSCAAIGAEVTGTVKAKNGRALTGALVTLTQSDGLFVESVYAGADGSFKLQTLQKGRSSLRARNPYFADVTVELELADTAKIRQDFKLSPLTNPAAIAATLSASAYFARIKFDKPIDKTWFQVECLTCHQIGNAFTRAPRPHELWQQISTRMLGNYGITDKAWIDRYAGKLETTFNGRPLTLARQKPVVDKEALPARIIEWKLPDGVIAHDVEIHPADGKFYTVDQGTDRIYITDPIANTTETYDIPRGGIPQGGKFFRLTGNPIPLGLTVARGPHSLQEGPNGHFYTTDAISGQIGEFDPQLRTYVGHEVGGNSLYPHTDRFDRLGRLWFTLSFSNEVGMFDTRSGEMRVIDLPTETDRPANPALVPYGIDVNPVDGSVWYASLMANRIGRIDPETFKVESFTPPTVGPRRMRFAADGMLWIPDFGLGRLVKLDTKTMKYTAYTIPPLAPGEVEAPYAVGVNPKTQEIWITANMSDRIFRFLPKEERFISYPLPTRGIYLRDMIFTREGMVCSASSPLPAGAAEGGMQEVICLDPVGDLPLPKPAT
jgi:streptogramin lyase